MITKFSSYGVVVLGLGSVAVGPAGFGGNVAADGLGFLVHIVKRSTEAAHAGKAGSVVIGLRHVAADGKAADSSALSRFEHVVQLGFANT